MEQNDPTKPGEALQFDKADYDAGAGALRCSVCNQELWDAYFQINGKATCERCRYEVEGSLNSGSGVGRFVRATLFGTLAAGLGAAIYFGVAALTGYEFGLIAIVVGLMVGGAVRKGSNARGGWLYQTLAMFLTYSSIVITYVPPAMKALDESNAPQKQAVTTGEPAPPVDDSARQSVAVRAVLLTLVVAVAFVAPFLALAEGVQNVMSLVIIGIGLYEAWKINKRTPLEITGPFRVSRGAAAPDVQS